MSTPTQAHPLIMALGMAAAAYVAAVVAFGMFVPGGIASFALSMAIPAVLLTGVCFVVAVPAQAEEPPVEP